MAAVAVLLVLFAMAAFASAATEQPSGYVTAWLFQNAAQLESMQGTNLDGLQSTQSVSGGPLPITGSATAREAPALVALAGLVAVAGAAGYAFAHSHRH